MQCFFFWTYVRIAVPIQQRQVGSIADYDPLNGNWGTVGSSRAAEKIGTLLSPPIRFLRFAYSYFYSCFFFSVQICFAISDSIGRDFWVTYSRGLWCVLFILFLIYLLFFALFHLLLCLWMFMLIVKSRQFEWLCGIFFFFE